MIRKWNWSLSLFAALTLILGSCSPLMPATYPNPSVAVSSPIPVQPMQTQGPVTDLSIPTSKQAWMPVGSEQVKKNEEILAIARPLLEKARAAYVTPGWLYVRSKTESFRVETSTLPDGTPIPTKWQDETWTLVDENGRAAQSVSIQDTGDEKTSQTSTFQNGVWKNLTYGTSDGAPEKTYSIPLDSGFLENAENYKDILELDYNTDQIGTEQVTVFIVSGPTHVSQSRPNKITKYYFSTETGLLLRIEEYEPSPKGEFELSYRIDTEIIEKVNQPPAEVMRYFE